MSYQTANNWLRPFTPKELSDTGKDTLLLMQPINTEATVSRPLFESRIQEFLRTGERPTDWTGREEAEAKRRKAAARYAELAEKYDGPAVSKVKTDYLANAMRHSKSIVNFKLEHGYQSLAQLKVFDYIEAYLNEFENPQDKVNAAFNIALKARNLANELAEFYFQSIDVSPAKDSEYDS